MASRMHVKRTKSLRLGIIEGERIDQSSEQLQLSR